MSRGPPNATHKQTRNAATTATNQHQLRNKRTQAEIQPGKQDPQSMETTVPDTNPVTTKETTPDTPAQTQADANKNNQNCREPGSNRGPLDLQSNALPTELSRLGKDYTTKVSMCRGSSPKSTSAKPNQKNYGLVRDLNPGPLAP